MILKTQRRFVRTVVTCPGHSHCERVLRETWWLLGCIPLYSRDIIEASNL